jgi:hypothetical protein
MPRSGTAVTAGLLGAVCLLAVLLCPAGARGQVGAVNEMTCEEAVARYRWMIATLRGCSRDEQCRAFGSAFLSAAGPITPRELGCRLYLNHQHSWDAARVAERHVMEKCRFISLDCGSGALAGRCVEGRCAPARAATEPAANCKTSEVVAARVAASELDLAGRSSAFRDLLANCDGRTLTELAVDYDDGRCRGGVDRLDGGSTWRPGGPPFRAFQVGREGPNALSISIRLQAREPWPRYQVTLGSPRCPSSLGIRVDHQKGRFASSWLEDDAHRPPEQWQCRTDADCGAMQVCELAWREWSQPRKAWRGSAGRCERGTRCGGSGRCPEGLRCDRDRVYSSATGVAIQPRCRPAVLGSADGIETEKDLMAALEAMKRDGAQDFGPVCRRVADCPAGVGVPCAPCKTASFPCVSKRIASGCRVMLSCGEELSLSAKGVDWLNIDCF